MLVNRVYWPSEAATAQLAADLAEGLARRGWRVAVIADGDGPPERGGVRIHRTGRADRHGGLLSRTTNYVLFLRAARRMLAGAARSGDFVVPMTDPPMLGAAVAPAAQRIGARVVHWIQDIYPEIVPAHAGAWLSVPLAPLARIRDRAWRQAAGCVCVGADMTPPLASAGVSADRIHVIPNWAPSELDAMPAPGVVEEYRRQSGTAGTFVVAYSGNLGRVHDMDTMIGAIRKLAGEPRVVFQFIGGGPRLPDVRRAVASLGLGNVRFVEARPRSELAVSLAAADAHLVSLKPAFDRMVNPSKLAGILAAGRPALYIGTTDGANARLLAHEACGHTFALGDSDGLAAAILHLRDNPAIAAELGRHARAAYTRHFTLTGALDRWGAILRSLL